MIPPASYGASLRKLAGAGISFAVGEKVKYFSASQQQWFDTEVVAANDVAGVQVALKPGTWIGPLEYATKLKKGGAAGSCVFAVGEKVKYFSRSQQQWFDTEVVAANDFAGV